MTSIAHTGTPNDENIPRSKNTRGNTSEPDFKTVHNKIAANSDNYISISSNYRIILSREMIK